MYLIKENYGVKDLEEVTDSLETHTKKTVDRYRKILQKSKRKKNDKYFWAKRSKLKINSDKTRIY